MELDTTRDDLRRQLAAARASLARDAHSAVDNAKVLTDWRHHFRNHPWLFCSVAAATGFLLIPQRRAPSASPAPPSATGGEAPPVAKAGMLAGMLSMAASIAARQSINYLARRGLDWLDLRAARADAESEAERSYMEQPHGPTTG